MSKRKIKTFRGHGVFSLCVNFYLGVYPLLLLQQINWGMESQVNSLLWKLSLIGLVALFGQPTYLFFEIKHLLQNDGIADKKDFAAILVFGGLSLIGLATQVWSIVWLISIFPILSTNVLLTIVALCFISSFSGVLGLMDLPALMVILSPPTVIHYYWKLLKNTELMRITIGTTTLLSILTTVVWFIK